MDLVGNLNWSEYKDAINDGHDTFSKDIMVWRRAQGSIQRYNEDPLTETFTDVNLECLINYNVFRTWPIFQNSETGQIDRQTMAVYLNIKYLSDNGYLTANNRMDYKADEDRFIFDGITYKDMGDTKAAQAQDDPLHIILILKREELQTGDEYNP